MKFREYYIRESISEFLLMENTFPLEQDLDYIWNNGFDKLFDKYKNDPLLFYNDAISGSSHTFDDIPPIDSSSLPSISAQLASQINPTKIFFGSNIKNRFYPGGVISLSFDSGLIKHI